MLKNIKEAREELESVLGDELKTRLKSDDLQDEISEMADSLTDVYTSDLLTWLADNYPCVEDAIKELGMPERDGTPDIIKAIMQGQYFANEELLNEAVRELQEELEEEENK